MTHSNFMSTLTRRLAAPALCVAAALLGGCAIAPSTPASITPAAAEPATKHAKTVAVAVGGVDAGSTKAKLHLSDATVTEALVAAIEKNKTFSRVVKGAGADYQLSVSLINADYPSFGASFMVKNEMAWSLKRADGTTVWQESIKSEGLATAGEAFAGSERLRMAGERAARDNIAQGLTKIGQLKL